VEAVFQPLGSDFHSDVVGSMVGTSGLDGVILASAYVQQRGVELIALKLKANAAVTQCFVGIRNGVSTVQGVKRLLDLGVSVFAVDTGTTRRLFHPKFCLTWRAKTGEVLVGSANLTYAGLGSNLEVGVRLKLDLSKPEHAAFQDALRQGLGRLLKSHPKNCFPILTAKEADALFQQGRLEDENSARFRTPVGSGTGGGAETPPPISLPFAPRPPSAAVAAPIKPAAAPPVFIPGPLVWSKPLLPRSDLQFPGKGGNRTGKLQLNQARFEVAGKVIDQTTYFRTAVFNALPWKGAGGTKEQVNARFALVIAGVLRGNFDLGLSHDPVRVSGQGNSTTWLHWGSAVPIIHDPGLIGRRLQLFAPARLGQPFTLWID